MTRTLKISTILGRGLAVGALSFCAAGLHASPALALDDSALPSGGQVTGGSASFDYSSPNELHVHQSSDRAVIDWDSFNIGSNALTQFHQNNSSSVVVNRVTGSGDPTQILGTLKANGIVMVLDRNGVIFGEGARVDVGGIVASTGSINDSAFMAGGTVQLSDIDSGSAIINRGTISVADAGIAAFVAPTVVNSGVIQAKLGKVALASGEKATLDLYGDGLIEVAVSDDGIQQAISNTGVLHADGGTIQITAAAARGVVNSVINIDGVVSASSATVEGGKIILHGGKITVAKDATLDASGTKGGSVIVYADDITHIAGAIKATGSSEDDGGFIETSAVGRVTIADTAHIDSGSGQWLIDPTNFTIANSGGDITTATLAAQLALNNVTIETADAGSDAGDIFVGNALTWTGNKTLTLKAHRNIEVNAAITNATGGSLVLRADKTGSGTGTLIFGASGSAAMSGGGRTDLYYNPTAYTAPTNYAAKVTGTNTAWMLVNDVTQLQAMNTNRSGSYALGRGIDASVTSTWNAGAGFVPVGNDSIRFTGRFDGLGHTITGLTINRPMTDYVGFFGRTNGATIRNVGLVGGSITGQSNVGGLVGLNETSIITNSYATSAVSGTANNVGGLVGYSHNASSITGSYATGSVSGTNNVGGLVGYNFLWSTINNSYATGVVAGNIQVGGLVGDNYDGASITNSYAMGSVSGTANVGGLVGRNNYTVTSSYWNTQTSGQSTSAGGSGRTTAQMMNMASFSGWSIRNAAGTGTIWRIYEGQTAPLLASFLTSLTVSAADVTVTYDANAYSGGSASYTGLKSGDTAAVLSGTLSYGGTAQGVVNAGTYGITMTGTLYSNQRGYDISYGPATSTLTIAKRDITATVHDDGRTYGDANQTWDWTNVTWNNLAGGQNGSVLDALSVSSTANAASNAGSTQTITISGFSDNNYNLTGYTAGALTIAKRDITAVVKDDSRAYGAANPAWDWTNVTWNNLANGQNGSVLDAFLLSSEAGAASEGGSFAITLTGFADNNYNLTAYTPGRLTVGAKPVLPSDAVRIVNAKLSATSTSVPHSNVHLVAKDDATGPTNVSVGCLAAMNGACVVR